MDITVARVKKLWKIKYSVPARFGSKICYRVWVDNELVYDGVSIMKEHLNKKEVLKWIKRKYNFDITDIKDYGSVRVDD